MERTSEICREAAVTEGQKHQFNLISYDPEKTGVNISSAVVEKQSYLPDI